MEETSFRRWWWSVRQPDPAARPVPRQSGEAAIYSVEYLTRTQGPREGADPDLWRAISLD